MLIVLEPEHNVGKIKKIKIQSYMELSCLNPNCNKHNENINVR